ncbi:MAG: hypothetical protein AAB960_00015 [Patescibacteria group bacterium]
MKEKKKLLHIRLEPVSAGRKPIEFDMDSMQSIFLRMGGSVFMNPLQGWRAHFHDDEARLQSADAAGVRPERVSRIPTNSRRIEDAFAHVEAWLLRPGTKVVVEPADKGDKFTYNRRVFPRMIIQAR